MVNKIDQYMLIGFFITICCSALFFSGKIQERHWNTGSPLKLYEHLDGNLYQASTQQIVKAQVEIDASQPDSNHKQKIQDLESQIERLQQNYDQLMMNFERKKRFP